MAIIGYHASHEQFSPAHLLKMVQLAEDCGFQAAMSSEHLNPWSRSQGHSGNGFTWLAAAMQATRTIPFGSLSIPGGARFHPVMLAQIIATLAEMFPGRLPWIAAGSGEALNETVIDPNWPEKAKRNERMKEAVDIMRALWSGETVTKTDGYHYTHEAKIWSLPETAPKIAGAALSVETAGWMGSWADALITVAKSQDELKAMLLAFDQAGGAGKPRHLQVHISWDTSLERAREHAHEQWRTNVLTPAQCANLRSVADFEKASAHIRPEHMEQYIYISNEPEVYIPYLQSFIDLGFDSVFIHNVGPNQQEFIETFGKTVLPNLIKYSPD